VSAGSDVEDVQGELVFAVSPLAGGGLKAECAPNHSLEIRALDFVLSPNIKPGEKPRRHEITVRLPAGGIYEGPLVSPSQVGTFLQCQRKWGWDKLDGLRPPPTKSQELGTAMHAQLENWLKEGVPPSGADGSRLIDSGALRAFPTPGTDGLSTEGCFVLQVTWYPAGTAMDPTSVVLWGFKDAEVVGAADTAGQGHVYDLKSTSDLQWAKTAKDLRTAVDAEGHVDIQGALYALATHAVRVGGAPDQVRASKPLKSPADLNHPKSRGGMAERSDQLRASKPLNLLRDFAVHLHWVYVQTRGKKVMHLTGGPGGVAMTAADCVAALVPHLPAIARISSILENKADAKRALGTGAPETAGRAGRAVLSARALPVDSRACGAYGGCPHLEKCQPDLSPLAMVTSMFAQDRARAARATDQTENTVTNSALLTRANELRAKSGVAPVAPVVAPAPKAAAVAKAPPVSAPAAKAAPVAPAPGKSAMALAMERARGGAPGAPTAPPVAAKVAPVSAPTMKSVTVDGMQFSAKVAQGADKKWNGEIEALNVQYAGAPSEVVLLACLQSKAATHLAGTSEDMAETPFDTGDEVVPEPAVEAPPPAKKRGRPAKAAPPAHADEDDHGGTPHDDNAADLAARAVVPASDDPTDPFVLYVDIVPLKSEGVVWRDVQALVDAARCTVEAQTGSSYLLLEYNTGPKVLAAQLAADLEASPLHGPYFANSMSLDMDVMRVLVAASAASWKGVK
jgi:hypothetical protein